ncbi:MAG: MFS transporter [Pseudomonadota bacterium]
MTDAATVDGIGDSPRTEIIPRPIKVYWSVGALGIAFMMNTVAGLSLFYTISILNIPPALAGIVVFVPKLFDAITDPLVGTWSDRVKSSTSRRRPFLFAGAFVSAFAFFMIFTTPNLGNTYLIAGYVLVALMVFAFGYTVFNIPYMSMPAEMTGDYHERSSIHSFRVVAVSIGGFLAGSGVPFLLERLGRTDPSSYFWVGLIGGVLIFLTLMGAWAGTSKARFTHAPQEKPAVLSEVRHVFTNPHFARLILLKFCQLFGVAATIAAFKYFLLNVIQRDFDDLAAYGLVAGLAGLVTAPLFLALSKKIGKQNTYIVSALCNVVAVTSWVVTGPEEPFVFMLARAALLGASGTGNVIMAMSMLTDIINYDAKLTGTRREGVFTSFYSFVEKFTFSLGPLIVGFALQLAGYSEDLSKEAKQSEDIRQALLLGVSYIPAVMGVLTIWLLAGYKLRQEDL